MKVAIFREIGKCRLDKYGILFYNGEIYLTNLLNIY